VTQLRPPFPLVHVGSRSEWRAWLRRNHAVSTGCWAVTVRKSSLHDGEVYVSPQDLNEECLCFGWIDSKPARVALREMPQAEANFEAFPPSTRRAILEWIGQAKTDATRAKRVLETAELAGRNIRANQWRQPRRDPLRD